MGTTTGLRTRDSQAEGRPPAGPNGARPLGRRRGLPGSRAVVGGFLVALAAVGVFAAYTQANAEPSVSWVVAARDVGVGRAVVAEDLGTLPIDLPGPLQERAFTEAQAADLVGTVTLAPLARGDLIEASDVVRPTAGGDLLAEELALALPGNRALAGVVQGGEPVNVLVTYDGPDGSYTSVVVRDARVLATSGDGGSTGTVVVTLGFTEPGQAIRVAHAANRGEIVLTRAIGLRGGDAGPDAYQPPPPEFGEAAVTDGQDEEPAPDDEGEPASDDEGSG